MTTRVFVHDKNGTRLDPTHPARARELIKKEKANVVCYYPFTIRLTERVGGHTQPIELKIDPGSKTTGVAMVLHGKKNQRSFGLLI